MAHLLTLGDLLLADEYPIEDYGYSFSVLADGVTFGVSAGVKGVVTSLLSDGDLVRTTRYGNREVSFVVQIDGPDLAFLAQGEAALRREIGRGNTLTWQPPDEFAVPTVFEVVDSEMVQQFDDLDELGRRRKFTLTLTCSPFARSKDLVTIAALAPPPVSPTTLTITNADTTANFFAFRGGGTPVTVTDAGDYVTATFPPGYADLITYAIGTPTDMSATRYVMWEMSGQPPQGFLAFGPGVATSLTPVLTRANASGTTLYVLDVAGLGPIDQLRTYPPAHDRDSVTMNVHDISRTDTMPVVSNKQTSRIIEVGGTERTPASIHVEKTTGSDGLGGVTILHTSPEDGSGYAPPLRRWRTSASTGPVTADSATLSGAWDDINYVSGGFNAKVPTSALPEGGYVLMARLRSATGTPNTGTLYWSTSTLIGSSTDQQGYTNGSIPITLGSTPLILPVAALSLPSVRTQTGKVEISLQAITGGAQIQLDEAWLFRSDEDCALTYVDNFQDNLWVDSPDVSSPVPRVWIGPSVSDRNHPGTALQAMGNHVLHPDGTAVFTAALSDNPATRATFYRRWHSNAAS